MSAGDYLLMVGDDPRQLDQLCHASAPALAAAGWQEHFASSFMRLYLTPTSRLETTGGFDGHGVLIGSLRDKSSGRRWSREESAGLASRGLDEDAAIALLDAAFGRYLLIRRAGRGAVVFRDPSGALETVGWRRQGVTILASTPVDALAPDNASIDPERIAIMADQPGEFHHDLAVTGFVPVAAGALAFIGDAGSTAVQLWRPSDIYRRRGDVPSHDVVRRTVEMSVRALVGEEGPWIAEVSGGLDSAIVAASLGRQKRDAVATWVNHVFPDAEGDETAYASAVADRLGFELTRAQRSSFVLDERILAQASRGFRPGINDLDPGYNLDIDCRIKALGAVGAITGQGGDAVFFQMATPLIGVDELMERGSGARADVLVDVARWNRRPVWPATWIRAFRRGARRRPGPATHPWLNDLDGVPPAKRIQISALAYSQTFQQAAVRTRHGICLNPLLSQPVVEMGLAISSTDLTRGGRDRSLVRAAFRDSLPAIVALRRSKGDVSAFYGRTVSENLPFLREYLLDGLLVAHGLVDRADLEVRLTREHLLWRGDHAGVLSLALLESWRREWGARLSRQKSDPVPVA